METLDPVKLDANVWFSIAMYCTIRSRVHLASTCRWLRSRLAHITAQITADWAGLNDNQRLVAAATCGDMELVRLFATRAKCKGWAIYRAIRWGHIDIVVYLEGLDLPMLNSVNVHGTKTAEYSYSVIVEYAQFVAKSAALNQQHNMSRQRSGRFIPFSARSDAGINGDLEALQCIESMIAISEMSQRNQIFMFAAANGHRHVIKWGIDSQHAGIRSSAINAITGAAAAGQESLVMWYLCNVKEASTKDICMWASRFGHTNILQLAYDCRGLNGIKIEPFNICVNAIMCNHLNVIQWVVDRGLLEKRSRVISLAKKHKRRNIVKWLEQLD